MAKKPKNGGRHPSDVFISYPKDDRAHAESIKVALEFFHNTDARRQRARDVIRAGTDNFIELIKVAGLNPNQDLRFSNWSDVSFRNLDVRGFDFTGARLCNCDFTDALIEGARFEAADIKGANLRNAKDWAAHVKWWTPPREPISTRHLRDGAIFQDAPFAPELVVVPAGSFMMGSPDGSGGDQGAVAEPGRESNETPRHAVTIAKPFAIGRFAVTRGEFSAFVRSTGYKTGPARGRHGLLSKYETRPSWRDPGFDQNNTHPVVSIRWADAIAYVNWLEQITGKPYRLPSEAEWEYAARAGTSTPYWWGSSISPTQANYDSRRVYEGGGTIGNYRKGTVPVDRFEPNPWGLYQVHGNVREHCADAWHNSYRDAPSDGSVWTEGGHRTRHVVRGGSWDGHPQYLRSADRSRYEREALDADLDGMRVVRTLG